MQYIIYFAFKAIRKQLQHIYNLIEWIVCWFWLYINNVQFKDFTTRGLPFISIAYRGGKCTIDKGFRMNNNLTGNPIGRTQRCILFVGENAILKIGKNVGISSTAIVALQSITIGDNVKIGGGVCIYDTDFHALDPLKRNNVDSDRETKMNCPVVINDNAFIGAHSTVLKGVTIGKNAIIGACSVVTKNIPDNEIWAGNPAHFIRKLL
jgi:acetyltransferase-like isoleucine patch superfamily enzyme